MFASHLLLLVTLCLSKLSVLLFIRSIFIWERRHRIILIYFSIAIVTLWGIGVVLALSVACSPVDIPGQPSLCSNRVCHTTLLFVDLTALLSTILTQRLILSQLLRLKLITIFDIITELGIFSLPVIFLSDLHMVSSKKRLVIAAFASRLP